MRYCTSMEDNKPLPEGFEDTLKAMMAAQKQGNLEQAEAAIVALASIVSAQAEKDVSPEMEACRRAEQCLALRDYTGAEAASREFLALKSKKEVGERSINAHWELCLLLLLLRRPLEALAQADVALEIGRQSDMDFIRWMAWDRWLFCAIWAGRTDGIVELATDSIGIIDEAVASLEGSMTSTAPSCARLRRAQCSIAIGDPWAAESDLEACREILVSSKQGTVLPGLRRIAARWWETTASCASLKGNHDQAIAALEQALQIRASLSAGSSAYEVDDLARCLKLYSKALAEVGRDSESTQAQEDAHGLWAELKLPPL